MVPWSPPKSSNQPLPSPSLSQHAIHCCSFAGFGPGKPGAARAIRDIVEHDDDAVVAHMLYSYQQRLQNYVSSSISKHSLTLSIINCWFSGNGILGLINFKSRAAFISAQAAGRQSRVLSQELSTIIRSYEPLFLYSISSRFILRIITFQQNLLWFQCGTTSKKDLR